jgi:hypothetical protein
MVEVVQALPVMNTAGRQVMETPQDVAQMLRLKASGIGIKAIARCVRRRMLNADSDGR